MKRELDIRKDAAVRALWSDHPLNRACRAAIGETFALRDLIAFVQRMPSEEFRACMFGAGVVSDRGVAR